MSSTIPPSPAESHFQPSPESVSDRAARAVSQLLPASLRVDWDELLRALMRQPHKLQAAQERYYRQQLELWQHFLLRPEPAAPDSLPPDAGTDDRRFAAQEWSQTPYFQFLRQTYRLNTDWLRDLLQSVDLEPARRRQLAFALEQHLDALAPSNFTATNPEVLRLAFESGGESLLRGMRHLQHDLARGRIAMSDEQAFAVGRNLAITPGAVVHENPIAQLIQYTPTTTRVRSRPLLIIPPFINKYYILDLQPHNSLVRFALDHGVQVFLVSWRNVPPELGSMDWEDYVERGVLEPINTTLQISRRRQLNALGFCVGGTLLASALAVMPRRERVTSLTLLASMLDFSEVGEIGNYVDEEYVRACESQFAAGGRMPGAALTQAFASLRANQLIWHFVIDNYLKGRTPPAFDLLYWNSDSANLPGRLYAWYLRNMYLENSLRVPGKLRLCGRPVDLGGIDAPAYVVATREDHIVPWHTAYASMHLLGGKRQFVLGASGHIAGIVNPPQAGKRRYWTHTGAPDSAEQWLAAAQESKGSWWPHWMSWLLPRSGATAAAPASLGSAAHPLIEAAPGRYVTESA